jgi:hypothetical protein
MPNNAMPNSEGLGISEIGRRIFGALPEIPGENAASYDELLTRMSETLKPGDLLEEVWVRDIVDLAWEALRLRRLKARLLAARAREGLVDVLFDLGAPNVSDTSRAWAARDPAAIESINATLSGAGLSMDSVMARTLSKSIRDIESIERMTMAAEARRNAALEQIDRHRAKFALRLRRTIEEVEGVELKRLENAPAIEAA